MFACVHWPSAQASGAPKIVEGFAPEFEVTAPGTVVFDIGGLRRIYGTPRQTAEAIAQRAGSGANVAVARNVETAVLAAQNFPGVTVIAPNRAGEALAPLGIEALPLSPEMWETLHGWGIRTLAEFAKLPPLGVAERLGSEGVYLQDLARGAVERPLRVEKQDVPYEDRIELDHPVELLEPLLFLMARLMNDLCGRLESEGLAANEVWVRLELETKKEHERSLRLPLPTRDSKAMLKLLQLDLEAHPPDAPMMAVSLGLKPVQPRRVQSGIFLPPTPEPDKLELTMARLRALVGQENVGVPEMLDTHRPAPFRLAVRQPVARDRQGKPPHFKARMTFRYLRPVVEAAVRLSGTRPSRVDASGIHGNVMTAAGPWRSCGDWWTASGWNRDEWDVSLSDGALYRIYCEPSSKWFVEGVYD